MCGFLSNTVTRRDGVRAIVARSSTVWIVMSPTFSSISLTQGFLWPLLAVLPMSMKCYNEWKIHGLQLPHLSGRRNRSHKFIVLPRVIQLK